MALTLACDARAQYAASPVGQGYASDTGHIEIQIDAGVAFDSNLTRALAAADQLSDRSISTNLRMSGVLASFDKSRVVLSGTLEAESFQTYTGLNHVRGGIEAEYQYRTSAAFDAVTFGAVAGAAVQRFDSALRDAGEYSFGFSARQMITDRISLFGAIAHREHDARSAVFDGRDNSLRLNLDYSLRPVGTLYLGAELRRGDLVSTGHPSLENLDISKVLVRDDAFPDGKFFAYRFDGKTALANAGVNWPLGQSGSIDISWRRIWSTADLIPRFASVASSYSANQYSIVYLTRF